MEVRRLDVGGITGQLLPMNMSHAIEMFIYDLAVRKDFQRRGVGRALITTLRELAAADGVATCFVPVEAEDLEAIAFYRSFDGSASPELSLPSTKASATR